MICWIDWGLPPPCSCCTAKALLLSIDIATTLSASEEGGTPLKRTAQGKRQPGKTYTDECWRQAYRRSSVCPVSDEASGCWPVSLLAGWAYWPVSRVPVPKWECCSVSHSPCHSARVGNQESWPVDRSQWLLSHRFGEPAPDSCGRLHPSASRLRVWRDTARRSAGR